MKWKYQEGHGWFLLGSVRRPSVHKNNALGTPFRVAQPDLIVEMATVRAVTGK